jgi:hypothetical protein
MGNTKSLLAALLATLLNISSVGAVPITFGNANVDRLDLQPPIVESGFQYNVVSGTGWELQTWFSNPGAALATFFSGQYAFPGDTTFAAVDYRGLEGRGQDLLFAGFLAGAPTGQTLLITTNPDSFQTFASGFTTAIDRLTITVSSLESSAGIIDNLVLNPVPEIRASAAAVPLACLALALVLVHDRRRRAV